MAVDNPSGKEAADREPPVVVAAAAQAPPYPSPVEAPRPGADVSDLPASVITSTTLFSAPVPPTRFNRYITRAFHARGGMGEIWRCMDTAICREVAMKRLVRTGENAKIRFLNEAQITGQLEHPGIVPVHDLCTDESGQPFYVMKFVRGRTLKQAIEDYHAPESAKDPSRPMKRAALLQNIMELCHAIAYAHSRGVVHRDIKPDNVMLGSYGETVLLDWGLAKVMGQPDVPSGPSGVRTSGSGGKSATTQAGSVMGSPPYMAPEMASGHAGDSDQRTDVYLLGATLYDVLTGRPPREGGSYEDMMDMARTCRPVPPRKVAKDIPRALEAICQKAMSHRREKRYGSAMELAEDLQRYLAGEPVTALPESIFSRTWRWAKRHRRMVVRTAAAVCMLVLVLVALAQVRQARRVAADFRLREQRRLEVQSFLKLTDQVRFYAANTDALDESAPYYDPQKAQMAADAAIALAGRWGGGLDELLQLPQQRENVQRELYELLLLQVQSELNSSTSPPQVPQLHNLLDRAQSMSPNPTRSFYRLRAACFRLDRRKKEADEQEARANDPRTPMSAWDWFLQGEQLRTKGRALGYPWDSDRKKLVDGMQPAIDAYRAALREDPGHYWSQLQLGRCLMSIGQRAQAIEVLGACIALRKDSPWGYTARGLALAFMKRPEESKRDLETALQLNPQFRPAILNQGVAAWLQGDADGALADFNKCLEGSGDQRVVEGAYYRGQVHLLRGDLRHAIDDFDLIIASRPSLRDAYLFRAQALLQSNETSRCVKDLDAYLGTHTPAELSELRGRLLRRAIIPRIPSQTRLEAEIKIRAIELAASEFAGAISQGRRSDETYADLADLLEGLGQIDNALQAYAKAIEAAPREPRWRIARGWAYANRGDHARAKSDFTEALRLDSANAEAHAGLGYALAGLKTSEEAKREAAHALVDDFGGRELDYLTLHRVACIYAQLSTIATEPATAHEDLAIKLLRQAIAIWKRGATGPDEIDLIKQDIARRVFPPSMLQRPDFRELLGGAMTVAD